MACGCCPCTADICGDVAILSGLRNPAWVGPVVLLDDVAVLPVFVLLVVVVVVVVEISVITFRLQFPFSINNKFLKFCK